MQQSAQSSNTFSSKTLLGKEVVEHHCLWTSVQVPIYLIRLCLEHPNVIPFGSGSKAQKYPLDPHPPGRINGTKNSVPQSWLQEWQSRKKHGKISKWFEMASSLAQCWNSDYQQGEWEGNTKTAWNKTKQHETTSYLRLYLTLNLSSGGLPHEMLLQLPVANTVVQDSCLPHCKQAHWEISQHPFQANEKQTNINKPYTVLDPMLWFSGHFENIKF